jgi:hypothetical protein
LGRGVWRLRSGRKGSEDGECGVGDAGLMLKLKVFAIAENGQSERPLYIRV